MAAECTRGDQTEVIAERKTGMYQNHEMDIMIFEETDALVRTLSGDEDNTGGEHGGSDW